MRPREFCHSIHLNNIIIEALNLSLYASRIEQSNKLSFSLKSMPDHFQPSGLYSMSCVPIVSLAKLNLFVIC